MVFLRAERMRAARDWVVILGGFGGGTVWGEIVGFGAVVWMNGIEDGKGEI